MWLLARSHREHLLRAGRPDSQVEALLSGDPLPAPLEALLPDGSSRWPLSPALARFLARVVLDLGPRSVLELGAGTSSLVVAEALSMRGGGRLTSVEQSPEWCAAAWARVQRVPEVDARMVVSEPKLALSEMGPVYLFESAREQVAERGPYDLVLVDAPQWYYGRDGALPLVHDHLAPGAWVILDDSRRKLERRTVLRWLRTYPGLSLVYLEPEFGGRGLAVLRLARAEAPKPDPLSVATNTLQALVYWNKSRRRAARLRSTPPPEPE